MPHVESSLDEENAEQDNGESQVGRRRRLSEGLPRDKNEDASDKQDGTEALEEVSKDFPEAVRLRRRRRILAVLCQATSDLIARETLVERAGEAANNFIDGQEMPFQIGQI